ncbi:MAG TPA: sugar ABC transporter permease [Rectinemataceae bacterium]|nr:sugar ABC transporter permease [Rectinemataceae bacterium]
MKPEPASPRARRARGRGGEGDLSEQGFAFLLLSPAAALIVIVILVPLGITFAYTLIDMNLLSDSKGRFSGLSNYAAVLGSSWFWESLGRTLYFTFVSLALETVLGLLMALLLAGEFPGVGLLRALVILPWAIPTNVSAALWKWILHPDYGALNALLSWMGLIKEYHAWLGQPWLAMNMVILADVWKMAPYSAIFFLAALQFINRSLYEAARIDGAGVFRRFRYVTFPHLVPTLLVVLVMRSMEKFKAFDLFYIMTKGGPANGTKVLTYDAYLRGFNNLDYSAAATISYVIAFMVLALTVVYLRVGRQEDIHD